VGLRDHNPQSDHSDIPHSAFRIPHSGSLQSSSLHARGLALFSALMELVEIILAFIVDILAAHNHTLPNAKALPLLDKAIRCLFSLGRLHLTLQRAPHYFTARQVLRLAQAFEKIRYLTGRAFDFSPWTSLTPDQLDAQKSPSPSQSSGNLQSSICNQQSSPAPKKALSPTQFIDNLQLAFDNQQSAKPQPASQSPKNPKSAIHNPQSSTATPSVPATPPVSPVPNVNAVPAATITATPGATLARICEDLVELAEELGLPHTFQTGFLPVQSPFQSEISNLKSEIPLSPSQSSVNPQSDVHSVHPVHPVHPPSPSQSEISNLKSEIPNPQSAIYNLQSNAPP
jgi:hypothetical protein